MIQMVQSLLERIQANNNALYGMTPYGGYNEYGVIYRYDTGAISDSVVLHFDFLKGFNPMEIF